MRAVVQRVTRASVSVADRVHGSIDSGLLVLLGAGLEDGPADVDYLAEKVVHLRIFADDAGKINRSVIDVGGGILAISQFTLFGDARKGRRPAFTAALAPEPAEALYLSFVAALAARGVGRVEKGVFGAHMAVELLNDGPVTILLDSKRLF